jgi:endonuclease G
MDFYVNDSIHTSDNLDYVNNPYDKGHMAPAADFNCTKEMLWLTFSYLNCALQDQYLNRGTWRFLESQEREWAKLEPVIVTIEVKFDKKCVKLSSGATVPAGFKKTVSLVKSKKNFIYYFPNSKPTSSKYSDYLVK